MLGTRNRVNPPASGSFHRILAILGLGLSGNADAEAVTLVLDRMRLETRLLDNAGEGHTESAWVPCSDRTKLRIKIEYRGAVGTREFIIAWQAHDDRVIYSRVVEPQNPGLSGGLNGTAGADVVVAGNFVAAGGGLENVDIGGIKAYKLLCLAKSGGVNVDAWGAVG